MKKYVSVLLVALILGACALPCYAAASVSAPGIRKFGLDSIVQTLELTDERGDIPFPTFYHKAWGGQKQPLVLYFHGSGTVGTYPARALFQFVPIGLSLLMQGRRYNSMVVYDADLAYYGAQECAETVSQYIDYAVSNGNVDKNRIYLIGFSYGGLAVSNLVSVFPTRFAAAVGLEAMSSVRAIPFIDVYTVKASDGHVPDPAVSQEYMQIPIGEHEMLPLNAALFRGWMDWLFAQRR